MSRGAAPYWAGAMLFQEDFIATNVLLQMVTAGRNRLRSLIGSWRAPVEAAALPHTVSRALGTETSDFLLSLSLFGTFRRAPPFGDESRQLLQSCQLS